MAPLPVTQPGWTLKRLTDYSKNAIIPEVEPQDKFNLYDYQTAAGRNQFKEWTRSLDKPQRAILNNRIKKLAQMGTGCPRGMLTPATGGYTHLLELVVNGKVALRPHLCKGPIDIESEFTFLLGATERDGSLVPPNAPKKAEERRLEVKANPDERRCVHESVPPHAQG